MLKNEAKVAAKNENKIQGWKYYNHALIPTCAPHEIPDIVPLQNGNIWNNRKVLLVQYTTDFDCKDETSFWYVVKDAPFELGALDRKYLNNIKRALGRCEARKIVPTEYGEEIWDVFQAAYQSYEGTNHKQDKDLFIKGLQHTNLEYWGAFNRETGRMAGWMSCRNEGDCTITVSAKYHPDLQGYNRPSDVLHYAVLNYYLNECHQRYVCSGSRNINHRTHAQEYKINNWKFRKAYCTLHLIIRPGFKWVVNIVYPFRRCLRLLDNIALIHQLNSFLLLYQFSKEGK